MASMVSTTARVRCRAWRRDSCIHAFSDVPGDECNMEEERAGARLRAGEGVAARGWRA